MEFLETSAKDGSNIEAAFDKIIMKVVDKQNYLTQGPSGGSGGGGGGARNVIRGPSYRQPTEPQEVSGGCC